MKAPTSLLMVLGFTLLSASSARAMDMGYDRDPGYEPGPGVNWSAVGKGIYDASTGLGDWVGKKFEGKKDSCAQKPSGVVLYRRAGADSESQMRKGQYEGLASLTREGSVLHLATDSGEYIDYPMPNENYASFAMFELCFNAEVYLDLSGCPSVQESALFDSRSCESPRSIDRMSAEAQMSQGLRAFAKEHNSSEDVEVSIYSYGYRCRASGFSPVEGVSATLLPTWTASERAHSEVFKRGVARMQAYRLARESAVSTPGFTRVSAFTCVDAPVPIRD